MKKNHKKQYFFWNFFLCYWITYFQNYDVRQTMSCFETMKHKNYVLNLLTFQLLRRCSKCFFFQTFYHSYLSIKHFLSTFVILSRTLYLIIKRMFECLEIWIIGQRAKFLYNIWFMIVFIQTFWTDWRNVTEIFVFG